MKRAAQNGGPVDGHSGLVLTKIDTFYFFSLTYAPKRFLTFPMTLVFNHLTSTLLYQLLLTSPFYLFTCVTSFLD